MADSTGSIADVAIALPGFADVVHVMTFQGGYNAAVVVAGAALLGVAAGIIGTFSLLRGRALMGDALAHSTLPGLALAFIVGSSLGIGGKHIWLLLLGATLSGILGVICVQLLTRYSRLREDAGIGAVLSCFFGAGVVLLSIIQSLGSGEEGGLHHFIYGQTAAMSSTDAYLTLAAGLLAVLVCGLFFKEFRLVCFDVQFAASEGWPVSRIDLIMMALVVLITVIGLQAVGLLLVVSLLIIPAVAARFWTEKLSVMALAAALVGGLSGYLGAVASALLPRLPAGAVIVLVSGVIFIISFLFAPRRGLLARALSHFSLRIRILEDHLLRELYEVQEHGAGNLHEMTEAVEISKVPVLRAQSRLFNRLCLCYFSWRELIRYVSSGSVRSLRFLPKGMERARKLTRNHRLWEEFLLTDVSLQASHVDFSADLVEHFLSADVITQLELRLESRLGPQQDESPLTSVHHIKGSA